MAGVVRLGVIVPSVNTVVENWYPKIVPDGVSVHFARNEFITKPVDFDQLKEQLRHLPTAAN